MTAAQMQAEIDRLVAENNALLAITKARLTMKLTDKGGVSVYGLGRWPVTLYAQQWRTLLGHSEAIVGFITANSETLARHEAAWTEAKQAPKAE